MLKYVSTPLYDMLLFGRVIIETMFIKSFVHYIMLRSVRKYISSNFTRNFEALISDFMEDLRYFFSVLHFQPHNGDEEVDYFEKETVLYLIFKSKKKQRLYILC